MNHLLDKHIFLNYFQTPLFELLPLGGLMKLFLNSLKIEIQLYLGNFVQFGELELEVHLDCWIKSLGWQ